MTKFQKVFLSFVLIATISPSLSSCNAALSRDEIIPLLAQELAFDENSGLTISFVAEYEHGSQSLLWYSVHGGHRTDYWAVECRRTTSGKYQVTAIHEPMTYAQDIVHVILGGEDIYLVNTPSCRSVVYRNENGEVVSQTNISPEQIPCVFPLRHPVNPSTCNFVDADGNDIH